MNVASLELCKELYELSGWDDTVWFHFKGRLYTSQEILGQTVSPGREPVSAYDLGYLMRKLPALIDRSRFLSLSHVDVANDGGGWVAGYTTNIDDVVKGKVTFKYDTVADTPEDAACKLAIEFFKQEILTKGAA